MKNIIKFISACLLVVSTGCNDAIDIEQPGRLDAKNAFKTIENLQSGLLGAYNFLDTTYEIGFTSAMTDECYRGRDNGGQNNAEQNFNINSSNGYVDDIWSSYYAAIGMANRIIEAAASIDRSKDPITYDDILGQAYAIRAFGHFQILTWFSTDYEDDNALAGLLLTSVTKDVFAQVPRSTNGAFYTQITEDLNTAAALITSTNLGKTFMGQDFITALRARMHAYKGDYTTAKQYAQDLLTTYNLANQGQYTAMFNDTNFEEVIFSLERSIGDTYDGQGTAGGGWAGSLYAFIDATEQGGPFMEMSRSVYNILEGTGDVRLSVCLNVAESIIDSGYQTNDNFLNDDVLLVYKYPGGQQPLLNDLKVFRASEMQLILAEAEADAGNFTEVGNLINDLRSERGASAVGIPTNESEAFGMILDERRLEFLFEGHRWVDLKRLGDRGGRALDRDARECSFLSACTLTNSDYRFTLPIPVSEIAANGAVQQNPNY